MRQLWIGVTNMTYDLDTLERETNISIKRSLRSISHIMKIMFNATVDWSSQEPTSFSDAVQENNQLATIL